MAVEEMMDYLENGNIRNSVNYPACDMGVCSQAGRIAIFHKNITIAPASRIFPFMTSRSKCKA